MSHPIENFENLSSEPIAGKENSELAALSALSAASQEHELPRDRAREEIKNRVVFRGQFGLGVILVCFILIGGFCGLPSWFGWEQYSYWLGIFFLLFCFAPMLSFFVMALADHFGFPLVARRVFGIATMVLAPCPFVIMGLMQTLPNGAVFSGDFVEQLVLAIIWIPQFIALVVAKLLMR